MSYLFEHPDFDDLLSQAAKKLNLPYAFVEKDYWVTYVLYRLKKENINDVIFKGGTSLTKGWNLLDRFSEDIDLLFVPATLSKDQKKKRLKKVKEVVCKFDGLSFDDENSKSSGHVREDRYNYPRKGRELPGGILPFIKLEMGFRGGDSPEVERVLQSYVGTVLEDAGSKDLAEDVAGYQFRVLDYRRTFVEKIFAIHTAYEKQETKEKFRHYYDIHVLLGQKDVRDFIGTKEYGELKAHVAEVTKEFFEGVKLPANLKFSKSDAFANTAEIIGILENALRTNRALFYKEPPAANEILESIAQIIEKL